MNENNRENIPKPEDIFKRLILCKGTENFNKLRNSTVLIIGVGAVGGFAAEVISRCAVGKIILVDMDIVDVSNINRQIVALISTIGSRKVDIAKARINDINPYCEIITYCEKVDGARVKELLDLHKPNIVVDAIDLMIQKSEIIKTCMENGVPIATSMGAARKNDPSYITYAPIMQSYSCALAKKVKDRVTALFKEDPDPKKKFMLSDKKVIRKTCCVFSTEAAMPHPKDAEGNKLSLPSFSVMTTMFGVWVANLAIGYLITGAFPKTQLEKTAVKENQKSQKGANKKLKKLMLEDLNDKESTDKEEENIEYKGTVESNSK